MGFDPGCFTLIENTSSRKTEMASLISSVLEGGRLHRVDALRLRGRLQFASGQLFGRLAKKALSIVMGQCWIRIRSVL